MDDTRIWFYAVMIFIAFVSWIRKRVKEVNESRNERGRSNEYKKQVEDRRRQESSQPGGQQSAAPARQPNSLKELFQKIADEQIKAQQEEQNQQQVAEPPPLPVTTRDEGFHQSETEFHQAEGTFHQDHQAATKHKRTVESVSLPHKKREHHPSNRTRRAIRVAFSDRRKIRDAFILKEILDKPKSMQ